LPTPVLFFASDCERYITGQILTVSGGPMVAARGGRDPSMMIFTTNRISGIHGGTGIAAKPGPRTVRDQHRD
jgi:hypothetical protein